MLLSYSVSNFHSFADRATISFVLNQRDKAQGWVRTSPSGERVSTAMAVLGANGAGKSNLVKAGPFLAWFMRDSFSLEPGQQLAFMRHEGHKNQPAEFEVEADDRNGERWRYELRVTSDHVLHEALYRKSSELGSRFSYVFIRDADGLGYQVRQQDFGLAESEAIKVRPNVSLLSWGKQYGATMASAILNFYLDTNLTMFGRTLPTQQALTLAASLFSEETPLQNQMRTLLRSWDLGLADVRMHRFETPDPANPTTPKATWFPMGLHRSNDQTFELPFTYESSGTQTALVLLWRLLPVLQHGGLAFIDELESDLHPHMIEPILRLFHDPDTNPQSAQIVFTCQSPEVLKVLERAQVTFVEKEDCRSNAYRGDDIEGLTSAHNLYAKYMAGALGSVPQL